MSSKDADATTPKDGSSLAGAGAGAGAGAAAGAGAGGMGSLYSPSDVESIGSSASSRPPGAASTSSLASLGATATATATTTATTTTKPGHTSLGASGALGAAALGPVGGLLGGEVAMPPVDEIKIMLELLMEDLNLTEDKKDVLRKLPDERKWMMLLQHLGERYRAGPQEVLQEIQEIQKLKDGADKELLTNLVVSLRSRPIRWISGFIDHGGFAVLLDNLNELESAKIHNEFEELYIKCLKSLMNNKIGLSAVLETEGALNVIALSLRSPSARTRALVLEIFGAVCLIPGGHSCVLQAMDALRDEANTRFRFEMVVYCLWLSCKGMTPLDKELQVASMSFINAVVCGGPGVDLEFRMHMRYEFIQLGLLQLIEKIVHLENDLLQTQIDVWIAGQDADEQEWFGRLEQKPFNKDDPEELSKRLLEAMRSTSCQGPYVSLQHHLALLPSNPLERLNYMMIIDKIVQQVVLQRDGEDPDPMAALVNIDVRSLVGDMTSTEILKEQEEKYRKQLEKSKRLEKEITSLSKGGEPASDEVKMKLMNAQRQIKELEALLKEKISTVEGGEALLEKFKALLGNIPRDAPGLSGAPAVSSTAPPPPPMPPGMGGPPPHHLLLCHRNGRTTATAASAMPPGMGGPPPPPPPPMPPGMGGGPPPPPPPPMPPGMGGPPPPPPPPMPPGMGGGPPPPPPPPMPPGMGGPPPPPPPPPGFGGPPPPPPPPGFGGPPPPPPPPGFGGGPPPPPPPPGMGGPPPPPPPGMGGPPPPPFGGGYAPASFAPAGPKPKPTNMSSKPLKSFNWTKLPPQKTKETIWGELDDEDIHKKLRGDGYNQFEELFAAKETKVADKPATSKEDLNKEITFLDPKRSQNCNIMLKAVKLDPKLIKRAILTVDMDTLPRFVLAELLKFIPTDDEIAALKQYEKEVSKLANAERFMYEISEISHYERKLKAMHFNASFAEFEDDAETLINGLQKASEDVIGSKKFKELLKVILALGNYMNSGARGGAYGFKLGSLLKLGDTKSTVQGRKHTLLHYLAEMIDTRFPNIQGFDKDLIHVEEGSKVTVAQIRLSLITIRENLKGVEDLLETLSKTEKSDKGPSGKEPKDAKEKQVDKKASNSSMLSTTSAASASSAKLGGKFIDIMSAFYEQTKKVYDDLEERFKKAEKTYEEALALYGEDPKTATPEDFFGTFAKFTQSVMAAKAENDQAAAKEVELRKREEAIKDREARKRNRKDTPTHKSNPAEKDGGLDDIISSIRTGKAFSNNDTPSAVPRQRRAHRDSHAAADGQKDAAAAAAGGATAGGHGGAGADGKRDDKDGAGAGEGKAGHKHISRETSSAHLKEKSFQTAEQGAVGRLRRQGSFKDRNGVPQGKDTLASAKSALHKDPTSGLRSTPSKEAMPVNLQKDLKSTGLLKESSRDIRNRFEAVAKTDTAPVPMPVASASASTPAAAPAVPTSPTKKQSQ
ncbi:hypothetical protein BC831DRAFT_467748 [Entophlyctis helioformis]|nr:hypothetical protein BC831DRAFT_467748 [Entophlyctis helioformis]